MHVAQRLTDCQVRKLVVWSQPSSTALIA